MFLLVVVNRETILGEHRNGPLSNVLGVAVVLVASGLGAFKLVRLAGWV